MTETSPPPHTLLSCIVKVSASQWLQKYNWDVAKAFGWLVTIAFNVNFSRFHHILSFTELSSKSLETVHQEWDEMNPIGQENRSIVTDAHTALQEEKMTLNLVEQVEQWAEKLLGIRDAHTCLYPTQVRIAQTLVGLRIDKNYREAEKKCELAQHRTPSYFEATICLSQILEHNGRKKRALEALLKARSYLQSQQFRETYTRRWRDQLDRFWSLCDETNSIKEALVACKELSDHSPDSTDYIDKAFEWTQRTDDLTDSFGLLSTIRDSDGHSLLTALFLSPAGADANFHKHLYSTLKHSPRLVIKAYNDAICGTENSQKILHHRYWYGVTLFYQGNFRDAMVQWEDISAAGESKTQAPGSAPHHFFRNGERLASAYIGMAQKQDLPQEIMQKYIKNLKQCKEWVDGHRPYNVNYLALLLGRLRHVTGNPRKGRAAVRKHMDAAFSLLEDDRDDNDWKGHFMLAEALLSLNDEDNALAAWSLIASAPSEESVCELSITCAGGCGWSWDGTQNLDRDLYVCRDCAHVQFEDDCLKKLRNDTLNERVC